MSDLPVLEADLHLYVDNNCSAELVARHVKAPVVHRAGPAAAMSAAPDDAEAGE